MNIYDPLAEALGIECSHKIDYSDCTTEYSSEYDKYATYGGGGAGELNGMWNKKHTEESKELIRQSNKIKDKTSWTCEECGSQKMVLNTIHNTKKRFCNKSCAASYSNKRRWL